MAPTGMKVYAKRVTLFDNYLGAHSTDLITLHSNTAAVQLNKDRNSGSKSH